MNASPRRWRIEAVRNQIERASWRMYPDEPDAAILDRTNSGMYLRKEARVGWHMWCAALGLSEDTISGERLPAAAIRKPLAQA